MKKNTNLFIQFYQIKRAKKAKLFTTFIVTLSKQFRKKRTVKEQHKSNKCKKKKKIVTICH